MCVYIYIYIYIYTYCIIPYYVILRRKYDSGFSSMTHGIPTHTLSRKPYLVLPETSINTFVYQHSYV